MNVKCAYCGKEFDKPLGEYNHSIKIGIKLYCSRDHSNLGRRINETPEEKKSIKSWYDLFLNISMTEEDKELEVFQRMVYFQWDYTRNPEKYRHLRQERMPIHVEYCRQPEYRKKKKVYDEQYRARKEYGDWWECAIILKNLDEQIDFRESKRQNKLYHKSTTKRKRAWRKQLNQSVKNLQQLI